MAQRTVDGWAHLRLLKAILSERLHFKHSQKKASGPKKTLWRKLQAPLQTKIRLNNTDHIDGCISHSRKNASRMAKKKKSKPTHQSLLTKASSNIAGTYNSYCEDTVWSSWQSVTQKKMYLTPRARTQTKNQRTRQHIPLTCVR